MKPRERRKHNRFYTGRCGKKRVDPAGHHASRRTLAVRRPNKRKYDLSRKD